MHFSVNWCHDLTHHQSQQHVLHLQQMMTLQQLSELILMEEILSGYSWWWSYYYKNLLWWTVSFMKLITLKYGHVDTIFGPSSPDFPLLVLFSSRTYLSLSCFHIFSITCTDSSFSYRRKLIWAHTQFCITCSAIIFNAFVFTVTSL